VSEPRETSASSAAASESESSIWELPLPALVAIAAIVICLVAAWVLRGATSDRRSTQFISKPQFVLWLIIFCAQAAVWVLALVPITRVTTRAFQTLRQSHQLAWHTAAGMIVSASLLLVLAVAFSIPPGQLPHTGPFRGLARALRQLPQGDQWPLRHHTEKIDLIAGCGFLVGLVAIAGIWLTGMAFRPLARDGAPTAATLRAFLQQRNDLNTLLAIVGAIVGLGTLATGALRNAIVAVHIAFPSVYVLIFGLYYSGLIALAYAPSYLAMKAAGERIRDKGAELVAPCDKTFVEVIAKRRALEDLLQLNLSASASFKAGVAILTPLAGSLVALLIGKGT
jgi:hypothetical protein